MTVPIHNLIDQEVELTDLPEPESTDGLYAVREGVLEIGEAKLRTFVCNDGQRYFDADDVEAFFGMEAG